MRLPLAGLRAAAAAALLLTAALAATPATFADPLPFRLLSPEGDPVPHARVTVVGRAGAVVTDANGLFHLNPVPPTPFQLAIFSEEGTWLGLIRVPSLAEGAPRDLKLLPVDRLEVILQSGVAPTTLAPPAAAPSVISRASRQERQTPRLTATVREIPGSGSLGSGHATVPSLRGLARGRTLLLIDDARVTTERRAGPSATYLDPFSVESLEVVRGPGSVTYGSDALGGIVHARTPSPSPDTFSGRYELSVNAADDFATGGVEANFPAGPGAILIQAHQRSFSEYRSPEGTVANSGARDRGFLVKGLAPAGAARWIFGVQVDQAQDVGKPTTDSENEPVRYPTEESIRFTAAAELPPPGGFTAIELRTFVGRYRLVTERERLPAGSTTRRIERSEAEASDASIRFLATRPIKEGILRFGLDTSSRIDLSATLTREDFDPNDRALSETEEPSIVSADRFDAGLFVEGERLLGGGRTSLIGGLRGQGIWTRNSDGFFGDRSTSEGTYSGYVATSVRPAEPWLLTFQVARGFRDPFLSDRYFAGITGRGIITGNPDLEPETSLQFDLSTRWSGDRARIAGYIYHYTIRDLIERFEVAPRAFAFRNRGRAVIEGVEVEVGLSLSKSLTSRIGLNYARGEIADDDIPPSDIPGPGLILSLHHRPTQRTWWRLGYRYAGRDDRPGETEITTPGHGILDLSGGIEIREGMELSLVMTNLLDKAYPASPDDDSVLAPGFEAAVVLNGSF
jgi:outer membrane receptor protein involved in Fe transport